MSPAEKQNRTSDRIDDLSYLGDVAQMTTEKLQDRRRECAALEEEVSYTRRLIQGKLDILRHYQGAGAGVDPASLIKALPSILADSPTTSRGQRHLKLHVPGGGRREMDILAGSVTDPTSMSAEEIDSALQRLENAEAQTSKQRRKLLDVIDAIDQEFVDRYKQESR